MSVTAYDLYIREQSFLQMQKPAAYSPGKCIVTTCYNGEIPSAWVLLNELKRLGCQLPVQIFHKIGELDQSQITLLESVMPGQISVKTITGTPKDYISRYGHKHGWACKIYALLESEYAENLWIDADNCPIRDPSFLFEDEEYLAKGSLFWRDLMSPDSADQYSSNSNMWAVFNIPPNDAEPFESGQLLIDKNKCWLQFALVRYYSDNCEIYYSFGGDKEVFKMAWQKIALLNGIRPLPINYQADPNVPYGFIPYGPFHKGTINAYKKWGGGSVMVQRARDGSELFNHRNLAKFKLQGNERMPDIANEDYYHQHLEDLRENLRHG